MTYEYYSKEIGKKFNYTGGILPFADFEDGVSYNSKEIEIQLKAGFPVGERVHMVKEIFGGEIVRIKEPKRTEKKMVIGVPPSKVERKKTKFDRVSDLYRD